VNEKPDMFGACNRGSWIRGLVMVIEGSSELCHGEIRNVMADLPCVACRVMVRKDGACRLLSKQGVECPRFSRVLPTRM
jgi:hypothetical protein